MFIWKSNQKRCNPYAQYTDENGTRYTRVPAELYEEIADPVPPADYSDETYYRTEQDDAPYVIFTKKSDEQIAAIRWEKIKVVRDGKMLTGGCKVVVGQDTTDPQNPVDIFKWFHSDTHSKVQQMALMQLGANIPANLQWKTMDGSFVTMDAALALSVFVSQVAQEQAIFAYAETLKTNQDDINVGWPETYVEVQP